MPQKVVGIREGEKVHELMINDEDARHTLEFDDHFIIIPGIYMQNPEKLEKFLAGRKGKPTREFFSYASNTNDQWLTVEDLRKLL
jgi:UDP-N-acetylglucosamine 4,6-dehydratase